MGCLTLNTSFQHYNSTVIAKPDKTDLQINITLHSDNVNVSARLMNTPLRIITKPLAVHNNLMVNIDLINYQMLKIITGVICDAEFEDSMYEIFKPVDGYFILKDGGTFNVLRHEL